MNIRDTGIRGYLKWLKQDQPAIYKAIAQHVVTHAPEAFSDLEQSRAMGSLMGTTSGGWHSGPDWSDRPSSEYRWNNPQVLASPYGNVASGLGGDTSGAWDPHYSFGRLGDTTQSDSGTTTTFDNTDTFNPSASSSDVASAANTGASSASVTSIIGGLVSAAGQVFLAKNQADIVKQVNQIQLQRAQMGLAPLDISTMGLGVPQIQVGLNKQTLTGGGIALAVVGGLGLLWLLSSGGHRARA